MQTGVGTQTVLPHDDAVELEDVVVRREWRTTLADNWTREAGTKHQSQHELVMYNALFLAQSAVADLTAKYRNCPTRGSCH